MKLAWHDIALPLLAGAQVFIIQWLSGAEFVRGNLLASNYAVALFVVCIVFAFCQIRNVK